MARRVQGFGFRVSDFGVRVHGFWFMDYPLWIMDYGLAFRARVAEVSAGFGACGVWGLGCRVWGVRV